MIGRRLQPVVGEDGIARPPEFERPGDYCGPLLGFTGDKPAVFYLLPNGRPGDIPHHVVSPPHTFRECADGSLEIRNSILHQGFISEREPDGSWHGYLDEGHSWREV